MRVRDGKPTLSMIAPRPLAERSGLHVDMPLVHCEHPASSLGVYNRLT